MTAYQPELGQMMFGQPPQPYACPEIMEAVLRAIAAEYDRVWWNIWQTDCPSPFDNSGPQANFRCPVFEVAAYSWGDEEQPWNFAWRNIRLSWYKWCGRGLSSNVEITPDLAAECLDDCLGVLRELEETESVFKACCVNMEQAA